jgi:5-(carboxyamino)imidazole ribonucleotide mutase
MPGGVPVGTLAIGSHGAKNSALLAIRMLATTRPELHQKLAAYHAKMAEQVGKETLT